MRGFCPSNLQELSSAVGELRRRPDSDVLASFYALRGQLVASDRR
jgi:acyl-CoA-binding protein